MTRAATLCVYIAGPHRHGVCACVYIGEGAREGGKDARGTQGCICARVRVDDDGYGMTRAARSQIGSVYLRLVISSLGVLYQVLKFFLAL